MEISYYGANCVLISTKQLQILVDPPMDEHGLKLPKLKPDVVLYSNLGRVNAAYTDAFCINSPGEFEIKAVSIKGIAASLHIDKPDEAPKSVIYTVSTNDVSLLATGNIAPELGNSQVEAIGEANVMVVPVGGKGLTLDAPAAAKLITSFEPQYVVPVHYDDGKTKYAMPQDKLATFLNEIGAKDVAPQPKVKISGKDLGEETQVVVLQIQS